MNDGEQHGERARASGAEAHPPLEPAGPLRALATDRFVGRHHESDRLTVALADTLAGHGRVVTIAGEPGIGKTRLLEEITRQARRRGALVLPARCWEAADAPPLWPWSQVLEAYLGRTDAATLRATLVPWAPAIAEVLPELRRRLGALEPAPHLEPERARLRAFDAFARMLAAASRRRPVVLVLDDLHAADAPSLALLDLVVRECADDRVLVLVAYRDVEVEAESPLAATLAAVARAAGHEHLRLSGLDAAEAERLLEQALGARPPASLVAGVVSRGEGNPFFLLELLRSAVEEGAIDAVPIGLRGLISRRLARLGDAALGALTTAAAIGREFDLRELERVSGHGWRDLVHWLEEARARRIVVELPSQVGRWRFAHALLRDGLYERIARAERSDLHRRIGLALEDLYAAEQPRHLAEIADHLVRGALAGDADRAFAYAVRAGRAAAARYAWEEAARHLERALGVWPLGEQRDEAARCELLVDLGTAVQCGGDPDRARAPLTEACEIARALGARGDARAPELLARAALGLGHMWGTVGIFDAPLVALLEEALAGLPADAPLRARLLARLAVAHYWSDEAGARERLSAEAVALARRIGDPGTLGHALYARHFTLWGPDREDERLAVAEESLRLGTFHRDSELALAGRYWRFLDRLERSEVDAARSDLREYARIADDIRQPYFQANALVPEAMFAMLEGRLDEAETLALRALELGRRGHSRNAEHYFGIQWLMLSRLRGAEDQAIDPAREFVDRVPAISAWRAALASLYATLGRREEAIREIEHVERLGFARSSRDANFLVTCAMVAEACVVLGRQPAARRLYDLLRPYAGHSVVIANGAGHMGVVAHYLGLLAGALGRAERADAWLADALVHYERWGARPFAARALLDRATVAWRTRTGVRAQAGTDPVRAMATRALALAAEVGLPPVVKAAEALLARLGATGMDVTGAPGGPANLFRREGRYWTIAYGGGMVRLADAKGLRHLGELLRVPGRDVHVLALVGALAGERGVGPSRLTGGDAGPLLDARAKDEYRRRIGELRAEMAEAERTSDLGRAARARAELEVLTGQLAAAVGLGGRDRRAAALAERARLNVTRAIHAVIRRIATGHAELARHLEASVVTGRFCRYEPAPDQRVDWEF